MNSPAYNEDIPLGAEETRTINFAAPANNTAFVLGTDSETTESYFNLATINALIRAIEDQLQAATPRYIYQIRRDGYKIRDLPSQLVKAETPGPVFPGFPLNLNPGQYQIYMQQPVTGTGLAARTLTMVWQKSLV